MTLSIPLHHNSGRRKPYMKRASERLQLWQTMHDMNPRGFRQPPMSKKNPRTHSNAPQTVLERLYAKLA